jgi:UDP-glucose 4-epimerase
MKKILITGGCGFIGSNLVDSLIEKNNEVIVIDNLSNGKMENTNSKAKYFFKDIRSLNKNFINDIKGVEIIYHLAADIPSITYSFNNPTNTLDNNIRSTTIMCDFAKLLSAKLIFAGTCAMYGNKFSNAYVFSKWKCEDICKFYNRMYKVPVVVTRFFNVYGKRQPTSGPYMSVLRIFQSLYSDNKPLTICGDGKQTRDFINVSDLCEGLILAMDIEEKFKTVNIGTGKSYPIIDVAKMFSNNIEYLPKRKGEVKHSKANKCELNNFIPKIKLEDYIEMWKKENHD